MAADDVVSVSIHPSIGIARIGNAADEWFLASDVRGGTPEDDDGYRNAKGHLKRQAARFRIYATLESGDVRELTAEDAKIEWRVEVANLKSGWYKYHYPLDLPVSGIEPPVRRNGTFNGKDRELLNIRPSPRTISGVNKSGSRYQFKDGEFLGKPVYLGELRTDDQGRLLFLGGQGESHPIVPETPPDTYANNEGWHDDTCDGPVRATVTIGGKTLEAKPAHVVVAPPNYGPGLFGVVTMDDVVQDLYFKEGWLEKPTSTSFSHDVWPIFDRLTGHQWVNDGIFLVAGDRTPLNARDPKVIDRLKDKSAGNAAYRDKVHALFRQPNQNRPEALPPLYGDAIGDRKKNGKLIDPTRQELWLTDTQYDHLQNWKDGNFHSDWKDVPPLPDFDALSPAEQSRELDRASMHECLGGPFHPGIEITWPFRLAIMWEDPYRLRTLPEGEAVRQDYGKTLSVAKALSKDGPHGASGPGSLTRWMGVPWQTDEASCNSGLLYSPELYLSSPSFWGARVPNQVLSMDAFNLAQSSEMTPQQADRHFSNRHLWLRDINGRGYDARINAMISRWWKLGLVEAKIPADGSDLPNPTFVETGRQSLAEDDPTLDMLNNVLALDGSEDGAEGLILARRSEAADDDDARDKRRYTLFDRGEI